MAALTAGSVLYHYSWTLSPSPPINYYLFDIISFYRPPLTVGKFRIMIIQGATCLIRLRDT